jgi:serine/threonine protein kinase
MTTENLIPATNEGLNNVDHFETFSALAIKSLGKELGSKHIDLIWDKVDEDNEDSIIAAFGALNEIINKRKSVLNQTKVHYRNLESQDEYVNDQRAISTEIIHISRSMPDKFLGNGSVAEVYSLIEGQGLCVKIVYNGEMYRQGNDIHKEGDFLINLEKFEVAGVRTPTLKETISTIDTNALVMEELKAANFRRILENKDELPEAFNFEDYFKSLEKYLSALHERGIYHNDFVLRNFMIDRTTGKPRVIDFGRSIFRRDIMGEKFDTQEEILIEKDRAGLHAAKIEIKKWLSQRTIDKRKD